MRSILILALLFSAGELNAQNKSDSLAIMNLIQSDYATYESLDIEAHRKNCTEDYLLIENGVVWNFEKEAAYMKSLTGKSKRINQFSNVSVRMDGYFAYAVYELKSAITRNAVTKNYQWTESVILTKKTGDWKISLIHSTKVKEW